MLAFATELPLATACSMQDFLHLCKEWVTSSRYTAFDRSLLDDPVGDGERTYEAGHEIMTLSACSVPKVGEVGGIRYVKTQPKEHMEWTTHVVGHKTQTEFWVAIRVSVESTALTARLPAARKPTLVRLLTRRFPGALDGGIPFEDGALRLDLKHIDFAAQLMQDRLGNRMPAIYCSSTGDGVVVPDANRMAAELDGMAHVIVEPSRSFSLRLAQEVAYANVYGGNVAVYWPGGRRRLYAANRLSAAEIERAIIDEVGAAYLNRRPTPTCTWAFLRESLSRRRVAQLRAEGSTEIAQYVTEFDAEIEAKSVQLEHAEREIARLNAEVRALSGAAAGGGSLLAAGNEVDLYRDERRDIVLAALADALIRLPSGGRRAHVLADLLAHNEVTGEAEGIEAELRGIFKGTERLAAKDKATLVRLGFVLDESGKHNRITFRGDNRYSFTFAKTPSDRRAGLNFISDIKSKLF